LRFRATPLSRTRGKLIGASQPSGELILQVKEVGAMLVEAFRAQMRTALGIARAPPAGSRPRSTLRGWHALREFEFAVSLEANLATAHAYLGLMKVFLGRARETRAHVAEAMRLSPRDPLLFLWHFFIGVADIHLGRMVHALESLR
jgi:hypothetical protein